MELGNYCQKYMKDCLARAILRMPKHQKEFWASKQTQAVKDDMRERMIKIRNEKRGR